MSSSDNSPDEQPLTDSTKSPYRKLRNRDVPRTDDTLRFKNRLLRTATSTSHFAQTRLLLSPQKLGFGTPPKPTIVNRQIAVTMDNDRDTRTQSTSGISRDERYAQDKITELEDALHRAMRRAEAAEDSLARNTDRLTGAVQLKTISDSVVAPKPFLGKPQEQEPMDWLDFFNKFCIYKGLREDEKINLFTMMMREGAADFLNAFLASCENEPSYDDLQEAFKNNYFKSPELKWRQASDLWSQSQGATESVTDYVTRMRKLGRRLEFPDQVLHMALINGLRGPIRMHVAQQGLTSLDQTIRSARIAEAAAVSAPDPLTTTLVEMMKASVQASEKQTNELQQLTHKVAALSAAPQRRETHAQRYTAAPQAPRNYIQRPAQTRPQMMQRNNYAQQANDRRDGGPRSFRPPNNTTACRNCGLQHAVGNCSARQQECRHCAKIGHFARVCRSARQQQD